MNAKSFNSHPCYLNGLNSPQNLAFRRYQRMPLLQRLLPQLVKVLNAQQLAEASCNLELQYWPLLGHAKSPYFFEVPAFLGFVPPDQPLQPTLVVERLMAAPCPPPPVDVAPAACNLERLRKHLDLSAAQCLRLLCAYLDYGRASWPYFELPAPALRNLLAAWWRVDLAAVDAALDERLSLLGLLAHPEPCDAESSSCSLASQLPMQASVVQALSLSYATDAELFAALQLTA